MIKRLLHPLSTSSFFIFGARGTGKSTFVNMQFVNNRTQVIDLLDPEVEDKYARHPHRLIQEWEALRRKPDWIFIDEIQKVPRLLDVCHLLMERHRQRFILTGSSARKIKRGAANLLAGRAFVYKLFPFTSIELGDEFLLDHALHWGMLPRIYSLSSAEERAQFLRSYTLTYLNEEIKAEQVLRRLEPFRLFLPVLGQVSGKIINHKKIADEIGVQTKTVQSYFQIVEETLLGFYLPAFHESVRKSQRLSPKFFLIDNGIKKALEGSLDQKPSPRTSVYGELFEHFVIQEIYKLNEYYQKDYQLSFFSTKNHVEVDLILSKGKGHILIEIKFSEKIDEKEVHTLHRVAESFPRVKGVYYLSRDPGRYKMESVLCVHWREFLRDFKDL